MSDLRPGFAVTAKAVAAVLVAAIAIVGPSLILGAIDAANDPTTTAGDLLVRGDDAGLDRLGTEGAADGAVLTVAGGEVAWAAASGGVSAAAGTFAARPATCAEGDRYRVSSGARLGSRYLCGPTNAWVLDSIDWSLAIGLRPTLAFDPEDLLDAVGGSVSTWRERQQGADLGILAAPGGSVAVLAGASSWGSLAAAEWNDSGTSPRLRSTVPGPLAAGARSLAIVVSSCATASAQAAGGWGSAVHGGSAWNVMARAAGGSAVTGLECFAACGAGSSAAPSGDTPQVLLATYSGSQYALAQAELSATPSWSTSIAATTLALATGARDGDGPLTLGGYSAAGTALPLMGRIHGAFVFARVLSSDERDALVVGLYTRWQ